MTQENKELLFKDLCARLSYGVVLQLTLWEEKTTDCRLTGIDEDGNLTADVPADCAFSIEGIKPYLRPMSSMSDEEISDLQKINCQFCFNKFDNFAYVGAADDGFCSVEEMSNILDYLNSHHFDYRGLIEKGLALEAPEGMYKID